MRVAAGRGARQPGLLNRESRPGTCVPEGNLATIAATNDQRGMERGEFGSEYIGSAVKSVFWTGVKVKVPDL